MSFVVSKLVYEQCIIKVYMDVEWNRLNNALYGKWCLGIQQ
jgi:hypothetical protein